jgi:sugar phosphate permease
MAQDHHPMFRYRWLIFVALALAYLFVYFHRLSMSVVADDLARDFQTSASVLGMLGSIYFYCYALMQFPAGLLSDSIGPRKVVTVFLAIATLGSLLFGVAGSIEMAFAGRILVGFGVSMVFIPTMKILSQWFRKTEFASMAGILNAVGGVGVLAATWLFALMTSRFGWRTSFEIIGVSTFVLVVLVWVVVRDRPKDKGWPGIDEVDGAGAAPAAAAEGAITLIQGARQVVSTAHFWPLAIWFFLDCGIFFGFGALWSGPYLMHVYGMSRDAAGALLSMIAWGMIVGSPLLGFLSDRVLKSRKKPFLICTGLLVALMLFLVLNPEGLSRTSLAGFFFLFSICASAIVVIGFTATKELFPVQIAGTSVGTVNLFPFLGGAVFMPMLGRVLDAFPRTDAGTYSLEAYRMLLVVLLASAVLALVCTFFIKETFDQ